MELGFYVPTRGPMATMDGYRALVAKGEALGFSHIAVSDHVVIPRGIASTYPYTDSGAYPGREECLEQLTIIATLAALTTTARLLTSIMVVPHRSPVVAAKTLASIDVLSGGRLTVGCGTGWMEEEFAALGTPPFAERGKVTDEYLRVFKELWTADDPVYEGDYVGFSDITFAPKPIQKPHPPIWIGGESKRALRRAAEHGDAWYPIGVNPRFPMNTLARYRSGVESLRILTEQAGRTPDSVGLTYWVYDYDPTRGRLTDDGQDHLFTGEPEQVAGDIRAMAEIGVGHLVFSLLRRNLDETLDAMDRFAANVMPLIYG